MKNLPDKASELIRLAVSDMEKVIATPGYKLNMLVWHKTMGGNCVVCAAGSVMAMSLDVPRYANIEPINKNNRIPSDRIIQSHTFGIFGENNDAKLFALDRFRQGLARRGLIEMGINPTEEIPEIIKIPPPEDDFNGLKETMLSMADSFECSGF